jgi:diguanylate cyclase (GGDEF)-like protein
MSWSTEILSGFTAALSSSVDEEQALAIAVDRVAEAFEAEVGAIVVGGRTAASVGWPRFDVPERALVALAGVGMGSIDVPGVGAAPAIVVDCDHDGADAKLILGRASGTLDVEERILLAAMVRVLAVSQRSLRTLAEERSLRARGELQARENAKLLRSLRGRQRLLEGLAAIQRSIAQRAPLGETLDAVVAVSGEMLCDEAPAVLMRDPDDDQRLRVVASRGQDVELLHEYERGRVGEGCVGRAIAESRVVAVGGEFPTMAAPVHEDGRAVGALVVSSRDVTKTFTRSDQRTLATIAQHASIAVTDARTVGAMLHQALHDRLTGLPNRGLFLDRLEHALNHTGRRGSVAAVLFIDIDRFKTINDSLGHAVGDEMLLDFTQRLMDCLRTGDTAARLGGDEFGLLLEDVGGPSGAEMVAQRLIESMKAPFRVQGREVFATVSVGIAVGRSTADDLLRNADVAMYRAKAEGKGSYAVFEASMQAEVLERLDLEADLQRAIERQELCVFYQPIIELETGVLHGFEALVRWNHPTRGLVPPMSFIPLAEETGLIVDIGRHVLREACQQVVQWHRLHPDTEPWTINVNVSGRQLEDPALAHDVARVLDETGIEPRKLVLEITETILMADTDQTIIALTALKELGVGLAVDDFGTGYSSLQYLRRFPIDVLKMAKPFVDGLGSGAEESALARAIVELGASLNLAIVAEGIELGVQLAQLRLLRCQLGQGFFYARPMAAAEMQAALANHLDPATSEWQVRPDESSYELGRWGASA